VCTKSRQFSLLQSRAVNNSTYVHKSPEERDAAESLLSRPSRFRDRVRAGVSALQQLRFLGPELTAAPQHVDVAQLRLRLRPRLPPRPRHRHCQHYMYHPKHSQGQHCSSLLTHPPRTQYPQARSCGVSVLGEGRNTTATRGESMREAMQCQGVRNVIRMSESQRQRGTELPRPA
jgi:hypothetical protein